MSNDILSREMHLNGAFIQETLIEYLYFVPELIKRIIHRAIVETLLNLSKISCNTMDLKISPNILSKIST